MFVFLCASREITIELASDNTQLVVWAQIAFTPKLGPQTLWPQHTPAPRLPSPPPPSMEYAQPCVLSSTGGLALGPEEVVRKMQQNVDVYIGTVKSDAHRHGVATVTTHRLIWMSADGKTGCQWALSQVTTGAVCVVS